MQDQNAKDEIVCGPWYTHLWVWFIIGPLVAVVCSSSVLVYMAVMHGDDVVMDNYYKQGRLINQRLIQDERAALMNVHGSLDFDLESGEVFLQLQSNTELPEQLLLMLNHPTSEKLDHQLTLQQTSPNRYRADLDQNLSFRWYLRLLPSIQTEQQNDADWRLLAEIDFRTEQFVELMPRH